MRLKTGIVVWLLATLLYVAPETVHGQVITAGPDSVRVLVPDTVAAEQDNKFFLANFKQPLKNWDKPAKAALFSAVIPGGGQFYNKAYWKLPIVYATGAVLGYFYFDNNKNYQDYRVALIRRRDGDPATVDQFADHPYLGEANGQTAVNALKYRRDFWRRNRDLTIILSVGAYALQVAEAYVHAHMKEFDISDELAIQVRPNLLPVSSQPGNLTPGLTLTLYTRPK